MALEDTKLARPIWWQAVLLDFLVKSVARAGFAALPTVWTKQPEERKHKRRSQPGNSIFKLLVVEYVAAVVVFLGSANEGWLNRPGI
jgi:hypothetical protein